jgi:hypothetical protein
MPKSACKNSNPLSQSFRSKHSNSRDSLFIFVIKILSLFLSFFFSAKVAVQIVDYYNLAANTLDLISSDECSVSEILGSKIYKVRSHVNTAEI